MAYSDPAIQWETTAQVDVVGDISLTFIIQPDHSDLKMFNSPADYSADH